MSAGDVGFAIGYRIGMAAAATVLAVRAGWASPAAFVGMIGGAQIGAVTAGVLADPTPRSVTVAAIVGAAAGWLVGCFNTERANR